MLLVVLPDSARSFVKTTGIAELGASRLGATFNDVESTTGTSVDTQR